MLEQVSVLQPMEDPVLEQMAVSLRNCSLWRARAEACWKRCEEEGSAEINGSSLHPYPLCATWGRERRSWE